MASVRLTGDRRLEGSRICRELVKAEPTTGTTNAVLPRTTPEIDVPRVGFLWWVPIFLCS